VRYRLSGDLPPGARKMLALGSMLYIVLTENVMSGSIYKLSTVILVS
jgi:hypothetical protein